MDEHTDERREPGDQPQGADRPEAGGRMLTIAAAVVLVVALIAAAFLLPRGQSSAPTGSSSTATSSNAAAAKARVVAATDFLKYLLSGDSLGTKSMLTDEAQSAITSAQWSDVASAIPTAAATYDPLTWSSEATAGFSFNVEESTGTIVAGTSAAETGTVEFVLMSGGSVETATLHLVRQGGTWRVVSMADQTGAQNIYDATFVKQLYQDAISQ